MKKNVGTRPRKTVRTEREQIAKRLAQAQRACDDGRNVDSNGARIKRLLARLARIKRSGASVG